MTATRLARRAGAGGGSDSWRPARTDFYRENVTAVCEVAQRLTSRLGVGPLVEAMLGLKPGRTIVLDDEGLEEGLRALADFADLKAPWTAGH